MSYLRKGRCPECGQPHWFRNWVGEHCARSVDGLSVIDFDLVLHRFKKMTDGKTDRDVEHLMIIEIKTADEKMRGAQRDTLSAFNGLLNEMIAVDGDPIGVKSRPGFIIPGAKKVIWHGAHLCRVPFRESAVGPFFWDNRAIDSRTLAKIINFELDAFNRRPLDIDRRHKAKPRIDAPLFESVA